MSFPSQSPEHKPCCKKCFRKVGIETYGTCNYDNCECHKHPQREDWRERLKADFPEIWRGKVYSNGGMNLTNCFDAMQAFIATVETDARQETAKAYGGCTSCFGKGFSTEQQGSIGSASYKIRGPELVYNPCKKCDRGTQIAKMLEATRPPEREAVMKEAELLWQEPTLCGKCNPAGKLCKECYANRRANSVLRALLSNLKKDV